MSHGHKTVHHQGVLNAFQKRQYVLEALRHAVKFTLEPGDCTRDPQHLHRAFGPFRFLAQAQSGATFLRVPKLLAEVCAASLDLNSYFAGFPGP